MNKLFLSKFWPTMAMFMVLAVVFGAYVHSEKQIDQANQNRLKSYILADELRQSSDDLTLMASSYVVTGNPRYKRYYQEMLDIRDGRKPRPEGYSSIYWDFVLAGAHSPQTRSEQPIALLELMRQAGFPQEELQKLAESKAHSDSLTAIECEAMKLAESVGKDKNVNHDKAEMLMHDDSYHQAKASIMRPISVLYKLMDKRTSDQIRNSERLAIAFRIVFMCCFFGTLLMLWVAYRDLRKILGGSADEIHAYLLKIGQGDFSSTITITQGMEKSVLAGLSEMQNKLYAHEVEHIEAEERIRRLNQLYAALSHCNQAIIRHPNEEELFPQICRDVVLFGGMKMAWIGMVDENMRIRPVASYGDGQEYLGSIRVSVDALDPLGQGPTGTAIRESQPFWCQDFLNDARTASWHEHAARFGLAASASLPLLCNGKAIGSFNLYAAEINAFDNDIRKLLLEMAQDISFALDNFAAETAHKTVEMALSESENRYHAYVDQAADALFVNDFSGKLIDFNRQACASLGYSREELLHMSVFDVETGLDLAQAQAVWSRILPNERFTLFGLHRRKDGTTFPVEVQLCCFDKIGERLYIGLVRDVTERVQAEEQLRIAATAFESQEGMIVTDANGLILKVNRAFTEISGYSGEEVVGHNPRILKSGRHNNDFYREMWQSINRTGGWQGEIWDRRKNGEEYPKWLTISAVKDKDGNVTNYIGAHYDITERKKAEERINELAFFDQLTGLPNRTLLRDRLRQIMTISSRKGGYGALLFIDLDNFKTLNDTLGHDMGDLLLIQVAQRLGASVRAGDTVARLGGDEFVVLLANLSIDQRSAASQTEAVGEKILETLNHPYQLKDVVYHNTPSIGATLFGDHQDEIDALLRQADIAMYRSKDAGRNTMRFFDSNMETIVMERAALEKDLRVAVKEGQFLLYYQAQVAGGQLTGAEVLVRWQHPQRGMVSPAEFIPLAEETRLILPLGHWVLETACTQLAIWASQPEMSHLTVAVNVSAHQFHQADFVDQVLAVLQSTGANPQRLKLELTESMLVSNVNLIIEKMFALKGKGVGFSLDDFGTGYSSLSYLKRLPLDQLKIDQSFVRDVLIDHNDAAIVRTIIALAQSLGFGVIAEGVETAEQRDFLSSAGCHAYQGYFFSRPLPIESFESFAKQTI
ncbi:MAG: EAL domain-containing protein [Desulfuromonadaceae bacterium]|nr:EAL domain-containing protein [Desulfuromonadaceae bacterium]MDD4129702.1 EAL domain-containing protein [Desulfuromonadaceae bacterium]